MSEVDRLRAEFAAERGMWLLEKRETAEEWRERERRWEEERRRREEDRKEREKRWDEERKRWEVERRRGQQALVRVFEVSSARTHSVRRAPVGGLARAGRRVASNPLPEGAQAGQDRSA
jgi:hypothetical protein